MKKVFFTLFVFSFSLFYNEIFSQSIQAGSYHSIILCSSGTVKTTGANWDGQLGDGTYNDANTPVLVSGLTGIIATAGGYYHTLALKNDGTVWAWGYNGYGQLGDNTTTERLIPVQVQGLTGIIAIASGAYHSLALKNDGTVWAWGDNGNGQLGDSSTTNRLVPVQVKTITGITSVAGGYYFSLALKNDGTVWAWGQNSSGQLGDNTTTQRTKPVQVHGFNNVGFLTGVTKISGGYSHSLARKSDGTAWGWGYNGYGNLGDGTTSQRNTPVQAVSLSTNVVTLSAGAYHSLYVKNDGTVWACGANWEGALGDNTTTTRYTPVQMLGLTGVLAVAGGYEHSLILKSDGTFWACGYNSEGELGDGSNIDKWKAVQVHDCCSSQPNIALSVTCLDLDTIEMTGSIQKSFYVHNTACGSLILSSITSSNAAFTASPSPDTVPLYDSTQITVTFSPSALGTYTATLTVFNNVKDTTICLSGFSIPAPTMTWNPSLFNISLPCSDTLKDTLFISNSGAGNLNWNLSVPSGMSDDFDPVVDVSAWSYNNGFISANCGSQSGNALYFNDNGTRQAITYDMNTVYGGTINFYIRLGNGGSCEYLDPGEDIVLEYSKDGGGSWTNISTYYSGTNFTFTQYNITIPVAAKSPSTRFRWRQLSHSGSCCDHWALDNIAVNLVSFVTVSPTSGSTPLSGKDTVFVNFISTGLTSGQYVSGITISSNDPTNPLVNIPCTLTVVGSPNMNVSVYDLTPPCVDFDSIMAFTTSKDSILLSNVGCDTLRIDSLKISSSLFTVVSSPSVIAPGQSKKIIMQFSPLVSGTFPGTLTIYTNELDTTLCLQGKAFSPPVITVNPTSFNITIPSCNDSSLNTLVINNIGGSNLIWNGSVSGNAGSGSGNPPTGYCYPTMYSSDPYSYINSVTTSGGITNITSPVDAGYNSNISVGMSYFNTVSASQVPGKSFTLSVQAQGSGNNAHYSIWVDWNRNGVFDGGELMYGAVAGNNSVSNFTINVPTNATTGATRMRIINWGGNAALPGVCANLSSYYGETEDYLFYVAQLGVTINPTSGTIAPSNSQNVQVNFYSKGLNSGVYNYTITITSNDPVTPTVIIPCTLTVAGAPKIVVSKTCITFPDSSMTYSNRKDSIYIKNTGCDTLKITSMTTATSPTFSMSPTSMNILPGDSAKGYLTFAPTTAGIFYDTITIVNNDVTKKVCLYGKAYLRPIISVAPTSFSVTVGCGDSSIKTLTVQNTGGSNLIYNLSSTGKRATFDGNGDYIRTSSNLSGQFTGESVTIEVWFKANAAGVIVSEIGSTSINAGWHDSQMEILSSGVVRVRVWSLASVNLGTVVFGTWNHAVLRYNKSTLNLDGFLNGVEAATNVSGDRSSPFESGYGQYYALGAIDGTNMGSGAYFNGQIDEFRVWNTARTNAQIQTNMNRTLSGNETGLVTYWNFDNSTANDLSPIGNNGVLNGNASIVLPNGPVTPQWITYPVSTNTIVPSGSFVDTVKFYSTGLSVGTYTYNISISNNDPLNNPLIVPALMQVVGVGKIKVSKTCMYLDSIMQYTTKKDSFYIKNTGCDTLKVTNITKQTLVYSVSPTSKNILTGDSAKFIVSYTPTSFPGPFLDTLSILNNDVTKKICLSGKSYQRPIQCHTPNSFNVSLACCDSITKNLKVCNSGGSNLIFDIKGGGMGLKGDTSILVIEDGTEWGVDMQNFIQTKFGKTPTKITSAQIAAANFSLYDIIITIGNQSSTYYNTISANKTKFEAFVNSGGILQYQLANYSGATVNLVGGVNAPNGNNETNNTVVLSTHPIVSGLPITLAGNDASAGYLTNLPGNAVTIIKTQSSAVPTTIEYTYGKGIVIVSTMTLGYLYTNCGSYPSSCPVLQRICAYSMSKIGTSSTWLTINPTADTVTTTAGDTSVINLKFKSCGKLVGSYNTNLILSSNDPLNSIDTIPVTLNVIGAGKITLSKTCLYLDSIMQFTTHKDSFYIKNTGCDTLKITNITKLTSTFSVTPTSGNILLGDSVKIYVTFAPTSYPGPFYDTLTILNSDVTKKVCLSGKSFQRPIQTHVPSSFNVSLGCCDSTTLPLEIYNTGGSNLINLLSGGGRKIKVALVAADYANYETDVQTKLMSTGKFTAVDIIDVQSFTPTLAQLNLYDAVLVWSNYCFSNATTLGNNLADYVDGGGGVVATMWSMYSGCNRIAGRFNSSNYWCIDNAGGGYTSGSQSLGTVYNASHPIMKGVTSFNGGSTAYRPNTFSVVTGASRIADGTDGRPLVATRIINGGYRVDLGMWPPSNDAQGGNWLPSTDGALLMANALLYSANASVEWLTVNPASDTIVPNDLATVNVKFKSCGLTVGTYTTNIVINSNDPLNASDTIPVAFNVVGTGKISFTKNCMYLDSIMEYTTNKDSIYIKNTGCDTLKVTNITKNTSVFSINTTTYSILPGDSSKLVVTFSPTSPGTFYDTLTFLNNDTTKKVCLSGKAYSRPVQCHNPNSFNIHFTICQDSIIDTLNVCNTGAGNLNYSLWTPKGRNVLLDGINDNVDLGTWFNYQTFTIEMWVKPGSTQNQYADIIDNNHTGSRSWVLQQNSFTLNQYTWGTNDGGGPIIINLNSNQWTHIALVRDGSTKTNKVYINGTFLSSYTGTSNVPYDGSQFVRLGRWGGGGRNWNGTMDEVRIYNKELSSAEIFTSVHNTLKGNENGLQGYWNFDNATANDLTANGRNGTLIGGAAITSPNAAFMPVTASTGTVSPSGNIAVPVKFKKVGLPFGTTNFPIYLNSNDPFNALDTINVSMLIDSLPPVAPVVNDTSVCFGNPNPPMTATAATGDTIKWYDVSLAIVHVGSVYTPTVTAVGTYTYFVTSTDSVSGCVSQKDTVRLYINAAPGKPTASDKSACFGSTIPNLTSTGTLPKWYSNPTLTSLVYTGSPFNTGQTAVGTYTYYVADSTGGCPKSISDTATLTIHPLPLKPIANDTSACFGGTIPSLVATVTGNDTVKWYNSVMVYVHTGSPYNTGQTAAGTYTYYVTASDTVTGCSSVRDTAKLIIYFTPLPTANNVNICFGSSAILTATGTNIKWYDSTLTFAFAGSPYNTGLTSVHTYTYYVTQTLNGCESSMKMVTLTINPIPTVPIAPDKESCFGQATPALTATGTNVKWYSDASLSTLVHSGSPFITGITAAGTYTFYVTQSSAGCTSPSDTVYLTIHALPATPIATNTFVCFGNPTPDLVATNITGNDTVHWYSNSTLTPIVFTGNPFATTQTAVATYTYYVTQTDTATGCRSKSDTVTLAINGAPVEPTANDMTVCFGNPTPSLTSTGTIPQWYNNPSLTPVVYTGSPYSTGLTAVGSYTFFVTDSVPGCPQSPADTATLTINPIPVAPVSVPQKDSICFGQATPSFSAAGTNIEWWSNPSTTTLVFNGSPFTPTVTVVGTYSYYVTQSALGCKSPSDTVIFKINPLPIVNFGPDVTQCGGTVTLNAGNPGSTYLWSDNSSAQTLVVSATGTYYVLVTNAGGCTMTDTINITINPIPATPVASNDTAICLGNPTPDLISNVVNTLWYNSSMTLVFTGDTFATGLTAAGSYTFYAGQTSLGCPSPLDTVHLTINFTPAISVNDTSVAYTGSNVTLFASGTNVIWYDTSMAIVHNGNTFATNDSAVGVYTYYISQTMNGCESTLDTMTLTIFPGSPFAFNQSGCFGLTIPDLNAVGVNLKWYSDAALTVLVGTGSPFATGQTAVGTYTYYVTQTVNNIQSPATTVLLTINPIPAAPIAGNQNACFGGTIPDLTATGANIQWYDTSGTMVYAGTPFASGQTAVGTYTYMATQSVSGCESPADTMTLTINALPVPPFAGNDTAICFGDPIPNLTATGSNITWYDGLGNFVTTGNSFPPGVSAPGSYTFIATQTNTVTTCESIGDTVILTINSTTPPVAPDVVVCFGTPVPPLTATGTNIQWYDTSGAVVGTGNSYNTGQVATGTYTYYVTQTNTVTTCSSPKDTVYLTISTPPSLAPVVQDTDACFGSIIPDLVATTGTIINWYSDAALNNLVFTGNPFATGQTTAGTYTFFATDSTAGCPEGPSDTVLLTINPQPATPVVNDTAICFGSTTPDLIFNGTNVQWYDTSLAIVFSGDTFSTGLTAVGSYTYYVTQTAPVTGCKSLSDSVLLTINALPAIPVALDTTVCSAATIPNLTATGTNVQWFNSSMVLVGTGNSYATGQTAAGTYTYYVTDLNAATGCESKTDTSVLTILQTPAVPLVNDTAICFGNPTPDLIASGTNIQWYDASWTLAFVGDTFATGHTLVGIYTYYVTDSLAGCRSAADTVKLIINATPAKPIALDTAVCSAATIPNLTATGTNVQWYDTSMTLVSTGNSFATGQTIAGTYTYYVTDLNAASGCESKADTSTLTIMISPPIPVANNVAVCFGNPIPPLSSTGTNVNWYSDAALTTLVHTGNTFNTGQTAVGVYTYWVTDSLTGCVSSTADSVSLLINTLPAKPTANNVTVCYGNPAVMTSTGANPQWYSDATLINMIHAGSPFNTAITAVGTYTYYVTDFASGCGNSVSDTATLTINPAPLVTVNTYTTAITQGNSTTLTAYNASTYTWAPPVNLSSTTGATVVASPTVTTSYSVTGTNQYGCSNSVTILVIVNPAGVSELSAVQDVNLYPNPAIDHFTLEFNSTLQTPIAIYLVNALGERIDVIQTEAMQGQGLMKHKYDISTATLSEGVYNVQIVTEQGTVNRRVVLFR